MTRTKFIVSAFVGLLVALGLGFVWGASGRFAVQNAFDEAQQKLDLAAARTALLEARVSLYNDNFGDATGSKSHYPRRCAACGLGPAD